jgi:hypothetical protein
MNFTMKFKEDTRIFTIKVPSLLSVVVSASHLCSSSQKVLAKRHGRMTDLKICLNNFTESNEISDEMLTLLECGMRGEPQEIDAEGNPMDSNLPLYQIFYDFKPCEFGDPVLLYFSS